MLTTMGGHSTRRGPLTVPEGLVAERFTVGGVEHVVFSWESRGGSSGSLGALSEGERAVCALLVTGASNAEIAAARQTSPRTVANQVASLFKKLGVASRFELVARFGGSAER